MPSCISRKAAPFLAAAAVWAPGGGWATGGSDGNFPADSAGRDAKTELSLYKPAFEAFKGLLDSDVLLTPMSSTKAGVSKEFKLYNIAGTSPARKELTLKFKHFASFGRALREAMLEAANVDHESPAMKIRDFRRAVINMNSLSGSSSQGNCISRILPVRANGGPIVVDRHPVVLLKEVIQNRFMVWDLNNDSSSRCRYENFEEDYVNGARWTLALLLDAEAESVAQAESVALARPGGAEAEPAWKKLVHYACPTSSELESRAQSEFFAEDDPAVLLLKFLEWTARAARPTGRTHQVTPTATPVSDWCFVYVSAFPLSDSPRSVAAWPFAGMRQRLPQCEPPAPGDHGDPRIATLFKAFPFMRDQRRAETRKIEGAHLTLLEEATRVLQDKADARTKAASAELANLFAKCVCPKPGEKIFLAEASATDAGFDRVVSNLRNNTFISRILSDSPPDPRLVTIAAWLKRGGKICGVFEVFLEFWQPRPPATARDWFPRDTVTLDESDLKKALRQDLVDLGEQMHRNPRYLAWARARGTGVGSKPHTLEVLKHLVEQINWNRSPINWNRWRWHWSEGGYVPYGSPPEEFSPWTLPPKATIMLRDIQGSGSLEWNDDGLRPIDI